MSFRTVWFITGEILIFTLDFYFSKNAFIVGNPLKLEILIFYNVKNALAFALFLFFLAV